MQRDFENKQLYNDKDNMDVSRSELTLHFDMEYIVLQIIGVHVTGIICFFELTLVLHRHCTVSGWLSG